MTDATTKTADRHENRAPRGGIVSPVNGRYYRGGQFLPLAPAEFKPGPAALMGSTRQVLWATRIRREELARLDEELTVRRLMLADPKAVDVAGVRQAIRRDEVARHALMVERSAARVIELRATFA